MNKFFVILAIISVSSLGSSIQSSKLQKHNYKAGETFNYLFENTEASYSTVSPKFQFKELVALEEIRAHVKMEIVTVDNGTTKKVTLSDVLYRIQTADDIKVKRSVTFSRATDLIPGFPKKFSYTYKVNQNDGEVEPLLGGFFKAFMSNQIGLTLYYKMQDFHAFHGSADGVATKELEEGQSSLSNAMAIPLEHGTFHNAPILTLYSRKDSREGIEQGYFKSIVMGNVYEMAAPAPQVDTNYQYSFYVPLSGPSSGLPSSGEMNETVSTTDRKTKAVNIIQRMVSLKLQK